MAASRLQRSRVLRKHRREGSRAPRLALALLAGAWLAAALPLGGCLQDAADTHYKFNNPNDTTPKNGGGNGETSTIAIAYVNELNDIVIVVNQGLIDQDMAGWTLMESTQTQVYTFPAITLTTGQFVRVHTKDTTGTDTTSDLYASGGDTVDWNSTNNTAILSDATGSGMDQCDRADPCWP